MFRPFEFSAGSLALDFIDTVAQRVAEPIELLVEPDDLRRWLSEAGLAIGTPLTPSGLERARGLREAIHDALLALLEDRALPAAAVDHINSVAARPDLRPQFIDGAVTFRAEDELEAVFSKIAADAIRNLAPHRRDRLRQCPECRMVFRDNSRPGRRKWCSSASGCGNRAKVRRHRANKKMEQRNG